MFKSILILSFLAQIYPAASCCTAWRAGGNPVRIAAQEVLIVWDEETKTEHFIRRANFQSEKPPGDFGFLVPTPTQPNLSEIPDRVFIELGEVSKPKIKLEKKAKLSFMPLLLRPLTATMGADATKESRSLASLEILDRAFVGGYEAVVLRASETDELLQWLEKNDYDARPALREWVAPYVEKNWILTAFKYIGENDGSPPSLSRASVCMSFETDAPLFPYRVPSDIRVKPENGSLLRIYFAGKERVTGEFEHGPDQAWTATTKFSNRGESVSAILDDVGMPETAKNSTWLTAFEDETWPGGAHDLYFKSSPEKESIIPPPIVRAQVSTIHLPLDVLAILLAIGFVIYKRRKNAAQA